MGKCSEARPAHNIRAHFKPQGIAHAGTVLWLEVSSDVTGRPGLLTLAQSDAEVKPYNLPSPKDAWSSSLAQNAPDELCHKSQVMLMLLAYVLADHGLITTPCRRSTRTHSSALCIVLAEFCGLRVHKSRSVLCRARQRGLARQRYRCQTCRLVGLTHPSSSPGTKTGAATYSPPCATFFSSQILVLRDGSC